jgi:DNA-binding LytR/AlgR family response regulator
VDDEKIVLQSLKEQLQFKFGADYFIETTESGREALKLYEDLVQKNEEVPLVIADYIMPDLKGDELLIRIREMNPKTVSIFLTGQATLKGIANAVNQAGVFRYIAKPWGKETLYTVVNEALGCYYEVRLVENKVQDLKTINGELEKSLSQILQEMEQNRRFLEFEERMTSVKQMAESITGQLQHSLLSIKNGLDIIQARLSGVSKEEAQDVPTSGVEDFYQMASEVIGDLVKIFDRKTMQSLMASFERNRYEAVYEQTSMLNLQISENVGELERRVNGGERPVKKEIEKVAAWDGEEIIILDVGDVLFFTSEESETFVITKKGKYKMKDTLDVLELRLGAYNFFRCHRGFLINLNHISKISPWFGANSYISKFDGFPYEIPISRNRIKEMKRILGF